MASLGASIPPELLEKIVLFVGNNDQLFQSRDGHLDLIARREEMQQLSACALTCVFWAQITRRRMFTMLVLRSSKDLQDLRRFFNTPLSSRLPPISEFLQVVTAIYNLGEPPWFLKIGLLTRQLQRSPPSHLYPRIYISGLSSTTALSKRSWRNAQHPLYFAVPRIVPVKQADVLRASFILQDLYFSDPNGFCNLLRDINIGDTTYDSSVCRDVTWDGNSTPSLSNLLLRVADLPQEYQELIKLGVSYRRVHTVTSGCTDDVFAALTTYHYRCKGLSTHEPTLSPADCVLLYNVMRVTLDSVRANGFLPCPHLHLSCNDFWPWSALSFKKGNSSGQFNWDFREARARFGGFIRFSCITYLSEEDHGNLSRIHRFTITVGLQAIFGDRTLSRFETELEAYDWNLLVDTVLGSPMLVKIEVWAGSFELLVTLVKRSGGALHVAESSLLLRYDNTGEYSSSEEAWREITLKEVEDVIETQNA